MVPMSMSSLAESAFDTELEAPAFSQARPDARSPLVSITIALAFAGCMIATANFNPFGEVAWMLVFLSVAIEAEVRSFNVPGWFAVSSLLARIGYLGMTVERPELMLFVAGALVAPGLLLPLYGAGFIRRGTLFASATLGALVGLHALPLLFIIAAAIGLPFALIRSHYRANRVTLPVFTMIAFAAAAIPLL